jgi:hypothetical protein
MERDFGAFEDAHQPVLEAQQAVERGVSGFADAELAGAVRNNNEIAEPASLTKRALAGHAPGIGRDRQLGQAQLAQAPYPILIRGEERAAVPASLSRAASGRLLPRMYYNSKA